MDNDKKAAVSAGTGCLTLLLTLLIRLFGGGFCLQYAVVNIAGFIRHSPVVIPWWACGLVAMMLPFRWVSLATLAVFIAMKAAGR